MKLTVPLPSTLSPYLWVSQYTWHNPDLSFCIRNTLLVLGGGVVKRLPDAQILKFRISKKRNPKDNFVAIQQACLAAPSLCYGFFVWVSNKLQALAVGIPRWCDHLSSARVSVSERDGRSCAALDLQPSITTVAWIWPHSHLHHDCTTRLSVCSLHRV